MIRKPFHLPEELIVAPVDTSTARKKSLLRHLEELSVALVETSPVQRKSLPHLLQAGNSAK